MSVIVPNARAFYVAAMAAALFRLLTLVALLWMPMGMATAPASAQALDHSAMAGSPHCGDQPDGGKAPASKAMDCTAACTALPASPAPIPALPAKPEAPRSLAVSAPFGGIVPEIATPPPRLG